MDFTLTNEQRMLHDAVERLAAEQYGFEVRRAAIANSFGFNANFWREFAELGVLSAALPESCGGLDAGPVATMLIMAALGKHLVIAPYVPTVICAAALLARAGTANQRQEYLPSILAGNNIFAFACAEGNDDHGLGHVETVARKVSGGHEIEGQKSLVIGAELSHHLMIVARTEEPSTSAKHTTIGVFIVPTNSAGVEAHHYRTIDGASASDIRFRRVFVPASARIGEGPDLTDAVERLRDEATAALCADAAGSIEAVLNATVQYARTRKQFGRPIGSFQVLQHRMVDMLLACEQAAAISHRAALALDDETQARRRAVSAAKSLVGRHGRFAMQAAVQIHGGIGTTDELDISHHFRRIEMFNLQLGTVDQHIRRYADLLDSE